MNCCWFQNNNIFKLIPVVAVKNYLVDLINYCKNIENKLTDIYVCITLTKTFGLNSKL